MIINLITDDITPKYKVCASVDEKKPFTNLLGILRKKVMIKSFEGHCIYICKGKKPPIPSIALLPPDYKKSPKQLGIKQGDYIAVKKESGGILERKKANKQNEENEKLKKEDPNAYAKKMKEIAAVQEFNNKKMEAINELSSDDELTIPKWIAVAECSLFCTAAAYAIITCHVGKWIFGRELSKGIVSLCAAIAAAVPTYFGEREHSKRVLELRETRPPVAAPADARMRPQDVRWMTGPEQQPRAEAVFERLVAAYRAKPGDVVDELLATMTPGPDLADPELVLAMSAFALHEKHAGLRATEVETLIQCTVAVAGADLDRVMLCGPPADPEERRRRGYKAANHAYTAAVSDALTTVCCVDPAGDPKREADVAAAWTLLEARVRWLFHVCSFAGDAGGATLYKGLSHQAMGTVTVVKDLARGTFLAWPALSAVSAEMKPAEALLLSGYTQATANPFGTGGDDGAEAEKPKKKPPAKKTKADKGKRPEPPPKKKAPADDKCTLLFKATKVLQAIDVRQTTPYTADEPVVLTPFNFFEVASTRPNTNVSDNSYDVDVRFSKAWAMDEAFVDDVRADAVRASSRLLLKLRVCVGDEQVGGVLLDKE